MRRQNSLLLLGSVGNIRVESNRQQRVIVEDSRGPSNDSLLITINVPGETKPRREIVLIARESLLDIHRVLRREHVRSRQPDARKRIRKSYRRDLLRDLVVISNTVVNC